MIPHHQGAIRMSENALRYLLCPGLIPLLDAIIVSQKKGHPADAAAAVADRMLIKTKIEGTAFPSRNRKPLVFRRLFAVKAYRGRRR